jgi:hypothetical protein
MDILERQFISLFSKLEEIKDDNEASHILQDKTYRKFIKDICNNKFTTLKDVEKIAKQINNKVVKKDKGRWYA